MEPEHIHPTWDDRAVTAVSEVVGGPMGTRSAGHPWWTPVRVLLVLTALTFAVGMWQKGHCYATAWSDQKSAYTHMCYSDLPPLYSARGFADQLFPYQQERHGDQAQQVMEYPVGISYFAWGTSVVAHWLDPHPGTQDAMLTFVVVNVIGLAAAALLITWFLVRAQPGRPWDAAGFALAPTLALTAIINWDLIAVVFVAGALWASARRQSFLAGIFIGLGTATKLYPLFLLGAILVIAVRRKEATPFIRALSGTLVAWVLANLPGLLLGRDDWVYFWHFNQKRGADLGSIWLVLQQWWGHDISISTINNVSAVFFLLWCAGVLALGLAARATPRLAQFGFLIVLGFLLVNKVYSPQYALWLLPLAALARPRWRDLAIWQACEVVYFASVWWYLDGDLAPSGGGDPPAYWIAVFIRLAGQLYLGFMVARDVLAPDRDPVEREASERDRSALLPA